MANWFTTMWSDPTTRATVARFLIFIFGALVKSGKIPTGYEGLGDFIGPFIMGGALLVPAGDKNASGVVTHSTTTTTKVEAMAPPTVAPIVVPMVSVATPMAPMPAPGTPLAQTIPHP